MVGSIKFLLKVGTSHEMRDTFVPFHLFISCGSHGQGKSLEEVKPMASKMVPCPHQWKVPSPMEQSRAPKSVFKFWNLLVQSIHSEKQKPIIDFHLTIFYLHSYWNKLIQFFVGGNSSKHADYPYFIKKLGHVYFGRSRALELLEVRQNSDTSRNSRDHPESPTLFKFLTFSASKPKLQDQVT